MEGTYRNNQAEQRVNSNRWNSTWCLFNDVLAVLSDCAEHLKECPGKVMESLKPLRAI